MRRETRPAGAVEAVRPPDKGHRRVNSVGTRPDPFGGPQKKWERCSRTRRDGEPCSASPLSGRDVCLAHSKGDAGDEG